MKITAVKGFAVHGGHRNLFIVKIETDAGISGLGEGGMSGRELAMQGMLDHCRGILLGMDPRRIEHVWQVLYRSWYFEGGNILGAVISAIDIALWDILGQSLGVPVYHLLGGAVRDELVFYATGARPDLAKQMGFIGGKMPLQHGPAECEEGMRQNLDKLPTMRDRVGDDFWLMFDCWMSLDLNYAVRLAHKAHDYGLKWIEEALSPDDYWGYAALKKAAPPGMLVTTGEHEATRWGFRMLLEMDCCDIIQPDVGWCGGVTELIKIANLADSRGVLMIPHGSSVYSYHFVVTRHNSPFAEFLMMAPKADEVAPMFHPQLIGEPVPVNGRLKLSDKPGFGVELNRDIPLHRPYPR